MGIIKKIKSKIPWWVKLNWRNQKIMPILFILELPLTVAGLALFGIADPDTYRTSLWQEGSNHGWNSDPSELLYAAANYKPIPAPTPWNSFITSWNVVISVLSLFIYLVKIVMYITKMMPPFFSSIIHAFVLALWLVSISQQAGSDYSDPNFPSRVPWYLTRGCGDPVDPKVQGGCRMAIGAFAVTVCMSTLFLTYVLVSVRFAVPDSEQKEEAKLSAEEEAALEESPLSYYDDKRFEFEMGAYNSQKTPTVSQFPVTPRTQAFNALEGRRVGAPAQIQITNSRNSTSPPNKDLPLRHHISMGAETYEKTRFA